MDIDFANVKEIKDNWIALRQKIPILGYVKAGHMKEPFSLEELTSGTNITFLERSLPTLAFAPGRNIGLMFNNTSFQDRMTWAVGGFLNTGSFSNVGDATDRISDANGCDLSGRVTGLPWYEEDGKKLFHLGLSYSHGFRNRDGEGARFGPRPESYLTDDRLVDTGELFIGRMDRVNMELAMVLGPLSFQGESLYAVVDAEGERQFWGGYLFGSLFLTGEHRSYNKSTGVFSGVTPKQDFHPLKGSWGAWEIAARISYVDLNDGGVKGGKEGNFTAGLNWYLNPYVRFTFNYIRANVDNRANPPIDQGHADVVQARIQVAF